MRKANIVSALMLIVGSLAMIFWAIPKYCSGGFGSGVPPSTLPNVLCWIILICSIILLASNLLALGKEAGEAPLSAKGWLNLCSMTILLLFSFFLMYILGFMLGGASIVALFLIFLRERISAAFALTSIAFPLCLYLLLTYGLGAPMPQAELTFLRF